jgi:hypothetical protein
VKGTRWARSYAAPAPTPFEWGGLHWHVVIDADRIRIRLVDGIPPDQIAQLGQVLQDHVAPKMKAFTR